MKQDQQVSVQQAPVQLYISGANRRIQNQPQLYTCQQVYSIKHESLLLANNLIYKKLTKSFHRIKKQRQQGLNHKQYDFQNNKQRLLIRKVHDVYNNSSKTNLIVKSKIDKMRNKVDRIKAQVEKDQLFLIADVDFTKIYAKPNLPQLPLTSTQSANSNRQKTK